MAIARYIKWHTVLLDVSVCAAVEGTDRADWYKDTGMLTFRNAAVTEAQGSVSVGNESVWTLR